MNAEIREFLKVKLRDLRDNPFRDFELYPIQEDRVVELLDSINETTFWENLLARRNGNFIELAYGHHRKVAAIRAFGDQHEIRIPVKALSDAMMIRIMGRENSEKYKCIPAAIDSPVKAAKTYLESHPEEERKIKESLSDGTQSDNLTSIRLRSGAPIIAKFLGMSLDAVKKSIERLNAIESGVVDNVALQLMPSTRAADNFIAAIKYAGIKREAQREIAAKVVEGGLYSPEEMIRAVKKLLPKVHKQGGVENEARLFKGIHLIDRLSEEMNGLCQGISKNDRIFLDSIWAFDRSHAQLESSIAKTKEALNKVKSDMISFREFQRILRIMYPLTDTRGTHLSPAGITINKEQKLMITLGALSGMVHYLDCVPSQETMEIPNSTVHDLLVLNPAKSWNGIEREGNEFVYHIGTGTLRHQKIDPQIKRALPGFLQCKGYDIDSSLKEALLSITNYMCKNTFLKNINGLYIAGNAVYACDNRRMIKQICLICPQLSGFVINARAAKLFKKYHKDIRSIGCIGGVFIIYLAEKFRMLSYRGKAKYPQVERLFKRAEDKRGTKIQVAFSPKELLVDLIFAKRYKSTFSVVCEGNVMRMEETHRGVRSEHTLHIIPTLKKKIVFKVDGRLFCESLLHHRNLKIGEDWILFHNDNHSSSCFLALKAKDNLQLVLFENEEYLTPRELKERYGLRLRRGLYDLHRLDKIPAMIKKGDIRYMKGSTPPERFSISLA